MLRAFRCGLALPLWAVACGAVALSAAPRAIPSLMTLLAIGVIASTIPAIVRRYGPSRRVEVLPALDDHYPPEISTIDDAAALARMDDAARPQMTRRRQR